MNGHPRRADGSAEGKQSDGQGNGWCVPDAYNQWAMELTTALRWTPNERQTGHRVNGSRAEEADRRDKESVREECGGKPTWLRNKTPTGVNTRPFGDD